MHMLDTLNTNRDAFIQGTFITVLLYTYWLYYCLYELDSWNHNPTEKLAQFESKVYAADITNCWISYN